MHTKVGVNQTYSDQVMPLTSLLSEVPSTSSCALHFALLLNKVHHPMKCHANSFKRVGESTRTKRKYEN